MRSNRTGGVSYPGQTAWYFHRTQLCFSADNIPGPLVPKGEMWLFTQSFAAGLSLSSEGTQKSFKRDLRVTTPMVGVGQVKVKSP